MTNHNQNNANDIANRNLIVIHVGAGNHNPSTKSHLRQLLTTALKATNSSSTTKNTSEIISYIKNTTIPAELHPLICQLLIKSQIIELSELTNTGFGSCLTSRGNVECDSSCLVLDLVNLKRYQFGRAADQASSCLPVTDCMLDLLASCSDKRHKDDLGLTRPTMKAGSNCRPPNLDLISDRMQAFYDKFKGQLHNDSALGVSDTIGVTIADSNGIVTGVSSGGSMFKDPGRIGCAAIIGSGCYSVLHKNMVVNVMCSGNGEDIIQMDLARHICNYIIANYQDDKMIFDIVEEGVLLASQTCDLKAIDNHFNSVLYVGLVGYFENIEEDYRVIFYWHSTESFVFGFRNGMDDIQFLFSQLNSGDLYKKGEILIR